MGELNPTAEQSEKVGPYRLEQRLGAGGMGAVWRAWDERLKRPVAIKKVLPEIQSRPTARARFRREAEATARLNHPAIVHVYDIVEIGDDDWLVMELVEGRTVREILREGPLAPARTVRLGREIAQGLAEAHAHGVIHRDLKASNVMITDDGRAKLFDFGIAKQIGPEDQDTTLSQTGIVVGTSYAMSPEQIQGLPLDARSDLFSLGSLLYEMLSGRPPFLAETPAATLTRICTFRQRSLREILPEVPRDLSELIDRLLEKDPVDRPQTAREVAEALEGIGAGLRGFSDASSRALPEPNKDVSSETIPEWLPDPRHLSPLTERKTESAQTTAPLPRRSPYQRTWAVLFALCLIASVAAFLVFQGSGGLLPEDPFALYQHGMRLLARADKPTHIDQAIESFRRAIARDETHAAAHAGLARAYYFKHGYETKDRMWLEQAQAMAERAVELDPYIAVAHVSLSLALGALDRPDEALRASKRAIELDPLDADAYYSLARAHESGGALEEAEKAYKAAIERRSDRLFHDSLGALYLRTGRIEDGISCFQNSIRSAPDGFTGYRNLGVAFYMRGDLAQAASQLQKALQIKPDHSLYANLGTIYFAQGFYKRSAAAFERALETPGGANSYLFWGNLGDAYRWIPEEKKAREAYLRAIQILREEMRPSAKDPIKRSRLALYLAKSGAKEEALRECAVVESLTQLDANTWFRLAVAYEAAGHREKALAALDRALPAGLPRQEIQRDPELLRLREDIRYHKLMTRTASR